MSLTLRLPEPSRAVIGMAERVRLVFGHDGVATITLCHPPLNIYDLDMRDGLIEAITAVRDVPDVRCVVSRRRGQSTSAQALTFPSSAPPSRSSMHGEFAGTATRGCRW